jgi:hypothetical protein
VKVRRWQVFFLLPVAVSAALTAPAGAAEAPTNDTALRVQGVAPRTTELVVCLWEKERAAALRLANDYSVAWGKNGHGEYRIRPADFAQCGGNEAVMFAVNNAASLAQNLHLVRFNQMARCVVRNPSVNIDGDFSQALETFNKRDARLEKFFAKIQSQKVKVSTALSLGMGMPESIQTAAKQCDAACAAWIESSNGFRLMFVEELMYEAKRNA